MKIGPLSMAVVLTGIGAILVKQNLKSFKDKIIKKFELKLEKNFNYQDIDF